MNNSTRTTEEVGKFNRRSRGLEEDNDHEEKVEKKKNSKERAGINRRHSRQEEVGRQAVGAEKKGGRDAKQ